jgi:hypothetical protein
MSDSLAVLIALSENFFDRMVMLKLCPVAKFS